MSYSSLVNDQIICCEQGTFSFKGELKQRCRLAWKRSKCADSLHLRASFACSVKGSRFFSVWASRISAILVHSLPMQSQEKAAAWRVIPCHIFQPFSWHHWHRLLCTKWQHAWSWCHDCQTQIVNRMWSPVKTAMCLLFIPFSVVRLVHFRSPLM